MTSYFCAQKLLIVNLVTSFVCFQNALKKRVMEMKIAILDNISGTGVNTRKSVSGMQETMLYARADPGFQVRG